MIPKEVERWWMAMQQIAGMAIDDQQATGD
jgi:hypothetical protein